MGFGVLGATSRRPPPPAAGGAVARPVAFRRDARPPLSPATPPRPARPRLATGCGRPGGGCPWRPPPRARQTPRPRRRRARRAPAARAASRRGGAPSAAPPAPAQRGVRCGLRACSARGRHDNTGSARGCATAPARRHPSCRSRGIIPIPILLHSSALLAHRGHSPDFRLPLARHSLPYLDRSSLSVLHCLGIDGASASTAMQSPRVAEQLPELPRSPLVSAIPTQKPSNEFPVRKVEDRTAPWPQAGGAA